MYIILISLHMPLFMVDSGKKRKGVFSWWESFNCHVQYSKKVLLQVAFSLCPDSTDHWTGKSSLDIKEEKSLTFQYFLSSFSLLFILDRKTVYSTFGCRFTSMGKSSFTHILFPSYSTLQLEELRLPTLIIGVG